MGRTMGRIAPIGNNEKKMIISPYFSFTGFFMNLRLPWLMAYLFKLLDVTELHP